MNPSDRNPPSGRPPTPRRSRLPRRRPEGTFRLGASPPTNLDEQRITLYLPADLLDLAETQAMEAGVSTVQIYCARLLSEAIEAARDRARVAGAEARQGPLSGFRAIEDDPEYLAEWSATVAPEAVAHDIHVIEAPAPPPTTPASTTMPDAAPSPAALVVLRHAATGSDDPTGFLAALRRGESIAAGSVAELLAAIRALEVEYRNQTFLDRRVAYALHRLAYEGQVLVTDAWPGTIDASTVDSLRVVQEAVDRVLSGEDIHYFAPDARPEPPR